MTKVPNPFLTATGGELPTQYDRPPEFHGFIEERDVRVPMRDGVHLSVDIYRPDTSEKLPAILAFAIYNKALQGPDIADALTPQPAWSPLWTGWLEAGDTRFITSRGYIHVIGAPRAIGKAEGGGSREFDSYDLIDLSFSVAASERFVLNFGVNNIFDTLPSTPILDAGLRVTNDVNSLLLGGNQEQANTYPSTYDVLGRDFFISASYRF